ncbi:MAG TPA: hypothetical protein VJ783_02370 [Pirellulales bacterium]|nr:hypothetical protein [Pirellulales bacterium]
MYELFTDEARKVMALANQEAIRFNQQYIGTGPSIARSRRLGSRRMTPP